MCVALDGVSRAMAHVTACAINTFYTWSPELIDSRIVPSPALFLSHVSFGFYARQQELL